ncbi:RING finger and KH domain-containing protein 1 [Triplophysa tibetana]|uniref:RING finger and KH domain-containing protein 1 n=1 Tax=Triplophysa tibetana TaxID=1572043 RepID=A0A5A9PA01_9TELE|nr:RING finger and KH domain-containing protein 1 [Triplophysa tibetana]
MDHDMAVSTTGQSNGVSLPPARDTDKESRDEDHQEALLFALDQLSRMALEKVDCLDGATGSDNCNGGGGYIDLQMLEHTNGSRESPGSCSPSPEYYGSGGSGGYHMAGSHSILADQSSVLRKRSVNMTECVPVPTSEHVAEIVGRQGCKIKALRAKTNTYIKTPVRGEDPVFIVTGRREDVEMAKREIISAAEHFSMIRASRCKVGGSGPSSGGSLPGPPNLPGQTTIQVRVPYRVVGLVVGPKGATIKRIQQQTHTYIVTPSREKDPVFEVTGMPENVDRAREEIETHITLRTGAFVDLQGDNDFHNNGTDVSLEGLGSLGLGGTLWSRASHSAPPPPATHHHSETFSASRRATDGGSPTSPFSTSSAGGSFSRNSSGLSGGAAGGGSFSGGSSSSGGSSTDCLHRIDKFVFKMSTMWTLDVSSKTKGTFYPIATRCESSKRCIGEIPPSRSHFSVQWFNPLDHHLHKCRIIDFICTFSVSKQVWLHESGFAFGTRTDSAMRKDLSLAHGSPSVSTGLHSETIQDFHPHEYGYWSNIEIATMNLGVLFDSNLSFESHVYDFTVPINYELLSLKHEYQICYSQCQLTPVCHKSTGVYDHVFT